MENKQQISHSPEDLQIKSIKAKRTYLVYSGKNKGGFMENALIYESTSAKLAARDYYMDGNYTTHTIYVVPFGVKNPKAKVFMPYVLQTEEITPGEVI